MISSYAPRFHSDEELKDIALYPIIEKVASDLDPFSYLEIGCREGDSLVRVVRNSPLLSVVIVADLWDGNYGGTSKGSPDHIVRLLDEVGYGGFFASLNGRSQETLANLVATFDLILVDGDHSEQGAAEDLKNSWRMLRPGGILVFDDISNPEHLYLGPLFDDLAGKWGAELILKSTVGVGAIAVRKSGVVDSHACDVVGVSVQN